jgi:tetratricopeptide (TPR) repeat protein
MRLRQRAILAMVLGSLPILATSCLTTKPNGTKPPNGGSADERAYYDRGLSLWKQEAWGQAVEELSRAIAINPGNVPAREYRAIAYINTGDFHGAINDYSEVIRLDPLNARIYGNRASVYRFLGQLDRALADFDQCLRLSPTNVVAYVGRAAVYNAKGDFEEGIKSLNDAIRISPNDAAIFVARGDAHFMSSQFSKAVEDYETAIELDGQNDRAYNELAWLRATCPVPGMRNGHAAVVAARKACEISQWKRAQWVDTLAAACAEAGDFGKAIQYEKRAIVLAGEDVKAQQEMKQRLSLFQIGLPYHEGEKQ